MLGRNALPYLVLAVAVAIVSSASILIRLSQAEGVSSLGIAAARMALASVILTPFAWPALKRDLPDVAARDIGLALISGALLAVHFASWISSLEYTSIASSTVLVTTNPLWVGLAAMLWLREPSGRGMLVGVALSLVGAALIFAADHNTVVSGQLRNAPLGNLLALVGAIAASGYLLIGRALRGRMRLLSYVWLAYSAAALILLACAGTTGSAIWGFSPLAWALLLALAVGPQLLGHTAFNWALRRVSATLVALSILGEPLGSALLAWLIFTEQPGALHLVGFVLTLLGIFVAARSEQVRSLEATRD